MRTPASISTANESPGLSRTASGKGDQRLVSEEAVESFRALIENRDANARALEGEQKQSLELDELRARSSDSENSSATELTRLHENQQLPIATLMYAAREAGGPPAPVTTSTTAVIDLIEKHVRQLLISEGGLSYRPTSKILLRLNRNTLAATELLLSRTDSGWRLHANARSADALHVIEEFTPELAKRFADRSLGKIEVEPELHAGSDHRENPR